MTTATRVALLGLGRMGAPMAARLAQGSFALTCWNRTERPDRVPAGARSAPTPADAVRDAEVVVTMLADAPALHQVLTGPDGLLSTLGSGSVVVDMSTIGRSAAEAAAQDIRGAGGDFVDAPVSGSVSAASSGALMAMAGGEQETIQRAGPVLLTLCRAVHHLGPVGAGQSMKLAINAMLAVTNQAIGELLEQAVASGVEREDAYDVLADSAVASPFVGYKRDSFLRPEESPVAFAIELMAKDVALALAQAARHGAPAALSEAASQALVEAVARGDGELDLSRVVPATTGASRA